MANLRADYSKALAKNREKYYDATQKLKKNYQQDLKTVREVSEDRIDKIKEINNRKITDVNDQNELKLKSMGQKLKEDQEYQGRIYRNKINEKTKEFNDQRVASATKFRRQIEDISDAYQKSLYEKERLNRNNLDRVKGNFDFRLNQLQNESDERHYEITEKSDESIKQLNREFSEQKKDLLRSNDDKIRNFVRQSTDRENELKDGFNQKYSELSKIQEEEQKRTQEKVDAIVKDARSQGNKDTEDLIFNYRRMLKDQSDKSIDMEDNLLHDKRMALDNQKRSYEKDLFNQRQKLNSLVTDGLGQQADLIAEEKRRNQEQLDLMGRRNDEFFQRYNRTTDEMSSGYTDSLNELNQEKSELLNKQNSDFKKRFTDFQKMSESKINDHDRSSESRYTNLKNESQDELLSQQKSYQKMIDRQRDNFNKTIVDITEKNEKAYEELYTDFNREKDEIKKLSADRLAKTTQENAREFGERLRLTVETFENKIMYMENQHKEQVEELNNKMNQIEKDYQTRLKTLKEYETNVRRDEKNNLMDTLHFTKRSLHAENEALRVAFNKKLEQTEEDHEREMASMKRQNSEEITRLNIENKKKLNVEVGRINKMHSDFVHESKLEKEMLIKNYEQKLDDLKRYYENTIADLKVLNEQQQKKNQMMS